MELETLITAMIIELAHFHMSNSSNNTIINRAKSIIDKNLYSKIKVEDICNSLKISPSHFRLLFKETFGKSPSQYIISSKIECAKKNAAANP